MEHLDSFDVCAKKGKRPCFASIQLNDTFIRRVYNLLGKAQSLIPFLISRFFRHERIQESSIVERAVNQFEYKTRDKRKKYEEADQKQLLKNMIFFY